MSLLDCTEEEAKDVIQKDKEIDRMSVRECQSDLTPDQKAESKKHRQGERTYVFTQRERPRNEPKEQIIAEMVRFLCENAEISAENVEILNKQGLISFSKGAETYEIRLTQKRKPK